MMKSPFGYWCDMEGCVMLVFKAQKDSFTFVNPIKPIREPVYVSQQKTNGWNDIVARVSGRMGDKAKNVALKFEGNSYPRNPESHPNFKAAFINNPQYTRVFN